MNILILSHMYPSTFNNIAGIFVHKQVKELVSLGCNVKVISPIPWAGFPLNRISKKWNKYSRVPLKDKIDGIEVYYPRYIEFPKGYSFHKSGQRMYKGVKELAYELHKKFKFDIIHSNVALPDGYCGMLLSKNFNIPHVITIHGQDFQNTISKSEVLRNRVFEVLNSGDQIITVSNKLKNIVKDYSIYKKIQVINNGVDINEIIENEHVPSMEFPNIDILSVSNLIKTKGIDINIKAMSKLVKKYPNLNYYIIGDGVERLNLNKLVEKYNLQENVFFLGKVEHEKVMKYMKHCKIFSLPSWKEGFGVVYVEAMVQGIPVIGIKGEGIEDVIQHGKNGFLVEANNVENLVDIIDNLLTNKDISDDIGKNAKKTIIEGFTWKHNAQKTFKLYESVINKKI
ncbi:glycosyltransferase [Clostridium tepidum]|jgi:glycosyltransferase involved in cell wall biosynthesis|uniref:Glycosyl transferase n=1 Tax=Clostridium tepidum TaxID=1962263 RepID=A0A1S9I369_9CLOT|nr:glycosyltransferase [Clostridium tepidum]MCR1935237.1 glycosyltransferase [Clostridium tepidum]MDU6878643.1 glycosyltransferase [Clostridium botulinum]OOO61923.1 glycosyl transferase [Clostridium tepidum]OOO64730.1 glycosyl transferase [Clostridium tepidum]